MTLAAQERHLKITSIFANPNQPRKFFDAVKLQELANSIQANGLLQAIVVTNAFKTGPEYLAPDAQPRAVVVGDDPDLNDLWQLLNRGSSRIPERLHQVAIDLAAQLVGPIDIEKSIDRLPQMATAGLMIVAGERRFRACQLAGLETCLCKVVKQMDDDTVEINALLENIQRQDMTALETASALNGRLEKLVAKCEGDREEAIKVLETETGWNRSTIFDFIRLLKVIPEAAAAFQAGRIQSLAIWYLSELEAEQQALLLKMIESGKCGTADKLRQTAKALKDGAYEPQGEQVSLIGDGYQLDPTACQLVARMEGMAAKLSDLAGSEDLDATLGKMTASQLQDMEQYVKMMQKTLKLIGKQVAYNEAAMNLADIA